MGCGVCGPHRGTGRTEEIILTSEVALVGSDGMHGLHIKIWGMQPHVIVSEVLRNRL